jgi:hypothetical protein
MKISHLKKNISVYALRIFSIAYFFIVFFFLYKFFPSLNFTNKGKRYS